VEIGTIAHSSANVWQAKLADGWSFGLGLSAIPSVRWPLRILAKSHVRRQLPGRVIVYCSGLQPRTAKKPQKNNANRSPT
jgi:hypothetical protein